LISCISTSLPAILFLAPLIFSLAELFDVQPPAAILAPLTALLLGLLIPLFSLTIRETRWLITGTALIVLLVAAALGVLHDSYNPQKPYKTDLRYVVRLEDHQARWASRSTRPDRWNKVFFTQASLKPTTYRYPLAAAQPTNELVSPAPYLDLPAPSLILTKDTTTDGRRHLYLHCQPAPGTTWIGPLGWFDYEAPPDSGFNLIITCPRDAPFAIDLTGRTMGLPAAAGFHGYPADVIPTPASFANTTMVQRSYSYSSSK